MLSGAGRQVHGDVCDERISLPMDAFKEHPEVYAKIAEVILIGDMMDVKVAWRCNTPQYWHCEVSSSEAGPICHKLGYSPQAITAMGLNPYGGPITLTAQGAKLLREGGAPDPSLAALLKLMTGRPRKPPITVHNVVSALGKDYIVALF